MAAAGRQACHWDLCVNEIVENLYLGSVKSTSQAATLDDMGITHILSLGVQAQNAPAGLVDSMFIDVGDHELADITPHLPVCI